jgi:hypothetical protein
MTSQLSSISKTTTIVAFIAFAALSFIALSIPTHAVGLKISPVLECVISRDLNGDSVTDIYTAVWGYNNLNAGVVSITAGGVDNKYTPNPTFRGQPTDFNPGRAYALFNNNFTSGNVVWRLKGPDGLARTATANSSSKACSEGTAALHPYDETHTYI